MGKKQYFKIKTNKEQINYKFSETHLIFIEIFLPVVFGGVVPTAFVGVEKCTGVNGGGTVFGAIPS